MTAISVFNSVSELVEEDYHCLRFTKFGKLIHCYDLIKLPLL